MSISCLSCEIKCIKTWNLLQVYCALETKVKIIPWGQGENNIYFRAQFSLFTRGKLFCTHSDSTKNDNYIYNSSTCVYFEANNNVNCKYDQLVIQGMNLDQMDKFCRNCTVHNNVTYLKVDIPREVYDLALADSMLWDPRIGNVKSYKICLHSLTTKNSESVKNYTDVLSKYLHFLINENLIKQQRIQGNCNNETRTLI